MFSAMVLFGFGLPKNVQKKVTKEVQKAFEIESFQMHAIAISEELNAKIPSKIGTDNFYKLTQSNELIGYAFVDQAPSKTAKFDYLVVFDADLKVKHSKVLIYREEYGGEIGSKRWLKQFLGKTGGDRVDHETNIDGIAGATISVRSMTNAMDDLLQTIEILQANKAL
ncbi:FMN-binding protein [Maribacter algarum]|uniref:FMN-binding protein n=1 Tax=Maribacter algarum (ex Zhang et al. 2020) TaxID=2578118 RepID=A0A5S3PH47_9FLAO|nr:FMN-binding protein [Maribacter algarum]